MTRFVVFCHSCGVSNDLSQDNVESTADDVTCSACGSEVVEIVDTARQDDQGGQNQPQVRLGLRMYVFRTFWEILEVLKTFLTFCRMYCRPVGNFGHRAFFASFTNTGAAWGGDFVNPGDWIDRIASQLLDEHRPSTKPTSKKAQDNLIEVVVRPNGAIGEPRDNEAFTCAGEPCSVCHDEFSEGEKVAELPCCHVCSNFS